MRANTPTESRVRAGTMLSIMCSVVLLLVPTLARSAETNSVISSDLINVWLLVTWGGARMYPYGRTNTRPCVTLPWRPPR